MIKIFSKEKQELNSDIDTWIVKWTTYKDKFMGSVEYPKVEKCYQAFTNKTEAIDFRNRINEAINMVGITSLPEAQVVQQERNKIE